MMNESTIAKHNQKTMRGNLYRTSGVDAQGQAVTLCPTTGRRFVARISVTSSGFMVNTPGGGSVQQYDWTAKGGRAELASVAAYLAKRTLEKSFGGRHGATGFVRMMTGCELPSAALAAWGYDRDNAPVGEVSIAAPYFDVLVPFKA